MSTQNVDIARFARNVEWDFFCDFQTPCFYEFSLVLDLQLPIVVALHLSSTKWKSQVLRQLPPMGQCYQDCEGTYHAGKHQNKKALSTHANSFLLYSSTNSSCTEPRTSSTVNYNIIQYHHPIHQPHHVAKDIACFPTSTWNDFNPKEVPCAIWGIF